MSKTGIIILCHGSRGEAALKDIPEKMRLIVNGVASLYGPKNADTVWAALQFNRPTLEEATEELTSRGIEDIIIVPYFIFSGRHIEEDIPEVIAALKTAYPGVSFTLTRTIGEGELFLPMIVDRIRESGAGKGLSVFPPVTAPQDIERQSMEIIEKYLPVELKLTAEEKTVLKRIIHASGDPQIAGQVRFSPGAVKAGIEAVKNGCAIFTDVRMTATGINPKNTAVNNCKIFCAMDEAENAGIPQGNQTRAAAAAKALGRRLDNNIIAIGNAPTALLALVELVKSENIKPALAVGIPVGFVQAAESKEALMQSGIPYIAVAGTRGGSAMAVAAVNAILKLASSR